jgi:hypothetical protein
VAWHWVGRHRAAVKQTIRNPERFRVDLAEGVHDELESCGRDVAAAERPPCAPRLLGSFALMAAVRTGLAKGMTCQMASLSLPDSAAS